MEILHHKTQVPEGSRGRACLQGAGSEPTGSRVQRHPLSVCIARQPFRKPGLCRLGGCFCVRAVPVHSLPVSTTCSLDAEYKVCKPFHTVLS